MKHARTDSLLDMSDDFSVDMALIASCCAVGVAALIYLLAI